MRAAFRLREDDVHSIMGRLPWKQPANVGGASCDILPLMLRRFCETNGYNPYAYEFSEMVRMGFVTRTEAMTMAECPPVPASEQRTLVARLRS